MRIILNIFEETEEKGKKRGYERLLDIYS